jgi:hypothetical protein
LRQDEIPAVGLVVLRQMRDIDHGPDPPGSRDGWQKRREHRRFPDHDTSLPLLPGTDVSVGKDAKQGVDSAIDNLPHRPVGAGQKRTVGTWQSSLSTSRTGLPVE